MKILIVDDSPTNLKLLRAVLEGNNLQVVEAPDGEQALAALEREPVDAVISDILMPRMDGYRLCHEVRKDARWRELPFIFHTATYNSPADEKLCYSVGGDKYLRKPASNEEILSALLESARNTGQRAARRAPLPPESDVLKEYSQRLVSKLEDKNQELEQARAELETANRELDDRVQLRTAELKIALQELESFSYSVSHDLRAPLRHICGFIDLLRRDGAGRLDETSLQHLQAMHLAARTMGELIDALLELSRVTRAEIRRRPVDLSALAAGVIADLRRAEPARVVKMKIEPGLRAHGDERLLRVALTNLLGNAWKYTRRQPGACVEFGVVPGGPIDTFYVRDNGAGFDMAYAHKLFGAFQRLHGAEEFEGIGIGLATTQRIIHRHRGSIRGESLNHQGATFYFTLGGPGPGDETAGNLN